MSDDLSERDTPSTVERMRGYGADSLTRLFRQPLDSGYAEAARRKASSPPPALWRRMSASGLRIVTLALAGLLVTVAYQYKVASLPQEKNARAGLASDVKHRRAQVEQMQKQVDRLRADVARRRDEALAGDSAEVTYWHNLESATGLGTVRGDGVVVKLVDAPTPLDPVTGKPVGTNLGMILDRDLQEVVNELLRAGAEAIAINGVRLSANWTIRAAGGVVLVDLRPVISPYQVSAIGPDSLEERFKDSPTGKKFRAYAEVYHMQFSVRKQRGLSLPSATEPQLRFARPSGAPSSSASPQPAVSGGS